MNFKDGGLISVNDPNAEIQGLTYGERVHQLVGNLTIVDHINKLEVIVTYNPTDPSTETGMFRSIKHRLFGGGSKGHQSSTAISPQNGTLKRP